MKEQKKTQLSWPSATSFHKSLVLLFSVLAILLLLVSGSTGAMAFSTSALSGSGVSSASGTGGKIQHVVIIMLENEQFGNVIGNPNGTFQNMLARQYASAARYFAVYHPSLPNYLAVVAGSYFGFGLGDQPPTPGGLPYSNIADLLQQKGLTWKTYQEQMPFPCDLQDFKASAYTVHHNPFVYFTDIQTNKQRCDNGVVNFAQLRSDLSSNSLANYSFIVPNDKKNSHDTNVSFSDQWLSTFVPTITNSPSFASTALFITYDEGSFNYAGFGSGQYFAAGGHVSCLLVSPFAKKGFQSLNFYSPYSLLATVEAIFNTGNLGRGDATAALMSDLFAIPIGTNGGTPTPPPSPTNGNPTATVCCSTIQFHVYENQSSLLIPETGKEVNVTVYFIVNGTAGSTTVTSSKFIGDGTVSFNVLTSTRVHYIVTYEGEPASCSNNVSTTEGASGVTNRFSFRSPPSLGMVLLVSIFEGSCS